MLSRLVDATKLFRGAFGHLSGSWVWAQLLKEKLHPQGDLFSVRVPGIQHPIWLRARTSDVEVFCQLFGRRELDFYHEPRASYIIDAGANIGLATVVLANRCPLAQIDAVEVDQGNLLMLRRNTAAYPNVTVHGVGLWSHRCKLRIVDPSADSWAFTVTEAPAEQEGAIVALGVDDLLSSSGRSQIDLLKLDIEGAELEVLGASAASWLGAVRVLAIELHDRFRPGCTQTLERAVSRLPHARESCGEYEVLRFGRSA